MVVSVKATEILIPHNTQNPVNSSSSVASERQMVERIAIDYGLSPSATTVAQVLE